MGRLFGFLLLLTACVTYGAVVTESSANSKLGLVCKNECKTCKMLAGEMKMGNTNHEETCERIQGGKLLEALGCKTMCLDLSELLLSHFGSFGTNVKKSACKTIGACSKPSSFFGLRKVKKKPPVADDGKKKILVVYEMLGGNGHKTAARAIVKAAKERQQQGADFHIQLVEIYKFMYGGVLSNQAIFGLQKKGYDFLFRSMPSILAANYDRNDLKPVVAGEKLSVDDAMLDHFLDYVRDVGYDYMISTHYMPSKIVGRLRNTEPAVQTKVSVVTCDYMTNRGWVPNPVDAMFVATEDGAAHLTHCDACPTPDKVHVTGIPIDTKYTKSMSVDQAWATLNSASEGKSGGWLRMDEKPKLPVVLVMGGGGGIGVRESLLEVLKLRTPTMIIAVCGRNAALYDELKLLKSELDKKSKDQFPHQLQVLGFCYLMDAVMVLPDVVVTKPGGLTTSEVLARGKVLYAVKPNHGQESNNADFLMEVGAGVKIEYPDILADKLERLLSNPAKLKAAQQAAKAAAKPDAAYRIIDWHLKELGIHNPGEGKVEGDETGPAPSLAPTTVSASAPASNTPTTQLRRSSMASSSTSTSAAPVESLGVEYPAKENSSSSFSTGSGSPTPQSGDSTPSDSKGSSESSDEFDESHGFSDDESYYSNFETWDPQFPPKAEPPEDQDHYRNHPYGVGGEGSYGRDTISRQYGAGK